MSDRYCKDGGYTIYAVYGEDENCDMGGYHSNPLLGYVEGSYQDVLEYAKKMNGFYAWGAGGYIKPANLDKQTKVIVLDKSVQLKRERKKKLQSLVGAELDSLIENIDSMSTDEIKSVLRNIKDSLQ